jgi:hypothetical protein
LRSAVGDPRLWESSYVQPTDDVLDSIDTDLRSFERLLGWSIETGPNGSSAGDGQEIHE